MKFTQIPETVFQELLLNAGILLSDFKPATAEVKSTDIIGATTGGISFTATPTFSDAGDDIDNCPKNMKELKRLDYWEVKMARRWTRRRLHRSVLCFLVLRRLPQSSPCC